MKKGTIIAIVVVAIVVMYSVITYNSMVSREEDVSKAWAQVENVYQRRADLVPQLVNTVKGAADFERKTLESVIEARAKATSVQFTADELTEENIAKFQKAQDQLGSSLGRMLATIERYPELKATQNFQDLQTQLEGTENRIATERQKFNDVVQKYSIIEVSMDRNIYVFSLPRIKNGTKECVSQMRLYLGL